jgi:hypothetical protein
MDAAPLPPSIPFPRAEGAGAPPPTRTPHRPDPPASLGASRAARVSDHVDLSPHAPTAHAMRRQALALVAARVGRGVDFLPSAVPATPGAIGLYRHPADKNAAATGVHAGRVLDVQA